MIHTALTERYGLEVPFVSAGMGFIALPPLAAAISNAGGFGQLACGTASPAVIHEMIAATRERTSRPFGVNLIIETTMFGPLTTAEHIEVCAEQRVPVVVFFWTPPPAEWIRRLKKAGCEVWLQTSSVATARAAIASGVDIIIAQGSEAGGHSRSTTGLFTLVPRMVDALNPTLGKTMLAGSAYAMPKFSAILPTPETTGDFEEMCLAAGESAALTAAITTAQEVVRTMGREAERALERQRPSAASTPVG